MIWWVASASACLPHGVAAHIFRKVPSSPVHPERMEKKARTLRSVSSLLKASVFTEKRGTR